MLLHLVKEAAYDDRRMLQAVTDHTHVQVFNPISPVVVQHGWEQCALVLKIICLDGEITDKLLHLEYLMIVGRSDSILLNKHIVLSKVCDQQTFSHPEIVPGLREEFLLLLVDEVVGPQLV